LSEFVSVHLDSGHPGVGTLVLSRPPTNAMTRQVYREIEQAAADVSNCDDIAAVVLFGGHGSKVMFDITERLDAANVPVQLILICGRNEALAANLRARKWRMPVNVIGFTKEIHKWMRAADFLIGKPGPGSIAEAMVRKLPVLIECNSWTLPQERYNAEWVLEKRVGIVLHSFKEIVDGVRQMLEPAALTEFRKNVASQNNRAIFEIPEILAKLLGEPSSIPAAEPSQVPAKVPATHST